ncbi:MAG TPA: hypothetical protein VGB00_19035 [Pyrinomonadaceae bacterium]|jgi:hypothetical protein
MKIYKISLVLLIACAMVGCAQIQNLVQPKSPTRTMKNFVEASMKKDVEGVKNSLSSGSLKMMEGLAKMQGKTLDQTIKEGEAGENEYKQVPETRNEKIEGDTATLEVKNEKTGEWDMLYFVRETDEWKIALDKSIEEMFKKSLGDWKMPNFGDSDSTTDGDKPSTEKKP